VDGSFIEVDEDEANSNCEGEEQSDECEGGKFWVEECRVKGKIASSIPCIDWYKTHLYPLLM